MSGQVIVTIVEKSWDMAVATTYEELLQGLGGLSEIPAGTGMFFDTGYTQYISITTEPMLFNIDIALISEEGLITEIYRDVAPGYIIESDFPARYFIEVNSGELEGIVVGDGVIIEYLIPPTPPTFWEQLQGMFMQIFPMIIMVGFTIGMVKMVSGSSEKVTVTCPICGRVIEIYDYNAVSRSEALKRHIELEHRIEYYPAIHGEPRRRLVEKYGSWAVGRAEAVCPEDDIAAVEREAKRLSETLKARYGGEAMEYVTIISPGQTTFYIGDVVSRVALEKENKRVRDLGLNEATWQVAQPKTIPEERYRTRRRRGIPEEIEYLPDSPEFLAYTIRDIGYEDKLRDAFQERMLKVRSR